MSAKLQDMRQKLRLRMHDAVPETGKWLRSVVQGYFNYHAIPGNGKRLQAFRDGVTRYWGRRCAAAARLAASIGSAWTDWCAGGDSQRPHHASVVSKCAL